RAPGPAAEPVPAADGPAHRPGRAHAVHGLGALVPVARGPRARGEARFRGCPLLPPVGRARREFLPNAPDELAARRHARERRPAVRRLVTGRRLATSADLV